MVGPSGRNGSHRDRCREIRGNISVVGRCRPQAEVRALALQRPVTRVAAVRVTLLLTQTAMRINARMGPDVESSQDAGRLVEPAGSGVRSRACVSA